MDNDMGGYNEAVSIWFQLVSLSLTAGHLPEFLLPFRKPKRIRTAFSPSQLLKLEQAFEKNQYVVGAERKELAKTLNLSETQVRPTSSRNLASEFMRIKAHDCG